MVSLIIVVAPGCGEKIAALATPSPPLAIGLPRVMVDDPGLAPRVTDFPAVVIELVIVRVPDAAGLIIVKGPVKTKLFVPVKFKPERTLKALPTVRVPLSALNCGAKLP